MTARDTSEALEVLAIEEADAWFEDLESTRWHGTRWHGASGRYDEVEPWAWARLHQRLRMVERRRTHLRPAAA